MKKNILTIALLAISVQLFSCDICGCSVTGTYLGVLPKFNYNLVGLKHNLTRYKSVHPAFFSTDVERTTYESFNTIELWGKYHINKKWQVLAFAPYHYKMQKEDGAANKVEQGIGDISLLTAYQLISPTLNETKTAHLLNVGVGIKLPTGKSNTGSTNYHNFTNLHPGSGATDIIGSVSYMIKRKRWTFNNGLNYIYKTKNNIDYKFGNNLNLKTQAFYKLKLKNKKVALIPNIAINYDYFNKDIQDTKSGLENDFSGGSFLTTNINLDIAFKKMYMSVGYNITLNNNYANGYTNRLNGFSLSLSYIIKPKEKKKKKEK